MLTLPSPAPPPGQASRSGRPVGGLQEEPDDDLDDDRVDGAVPQLSRRTTGAFLERSRRPARLKIFARTVESGISSV
jgi:hypothetical protein